VKICTNALLISAPFVISMATGAIVKASPR
jgi:hypothetical protein